MLPQSDALSEEFEKLKKESEELSIVRVVVGRSAH
jgi:hypothetical protein